MAPRNVENGKNERIYGNALLHDFCLAIPYGSLESFTRSLVHSITLTPSLARASHSFVHQDSPSF